MALFATFSDLVRPADPRRRIVLVGGGHSHVQTLRRLAMEPRPDLHVTVVLDTPVAVYSGMVPGFVAGQYRADELEIDVVPLARRAGAAVVLRRAVRIDAGRRRIEVEGRPPVAYDLASLDVGSTVAGLDTPGVRQHAIATRPIGRFVERIDEVLQRPRELRDTPRVVVAGAGAGGVELAFAIRRRLAEDLRQVTVTLVDSGDEILPRYGERLRRKVLAAARAAGIEILTGQAVERADATSITLSDGTTLPCDLLLWVTGAVSQSIFTDSGLPTDDRGFVRSRDTLQVDGHDDLFAVGDCATLINYPATPKAGVYAVRQGPVVTDNLLAMVDGRPLERYRPQSDFLTLLNLADGTAIGGKWGLAFEGRWVMALKDWIDRRFMRRFQVLDSGGSVSGDMPAMPPMDELCGGCAAKVAQSSLQAALSRLPEAVPDPAVTLGLDEADDAAAITTPSGDQLTVSVDAFTAFTDDPWLVGRVAAINAASDLLAKGVEPRHALALVTVPARLAEDDPATTEDLLYQVLMGVRHALDQLGTTLVGGHTTTGEQLTVGLSISGFATRGQQLWTIDRLRPGQRLILTKALGTGVIFHADMRGRARGSWIEAAIESMTRANLDACRVAGRVGVAAATDVTGFGLAGHAAEMARASDAVAVIDVAALPALPGAVELLARGERSTFHRHNALARSSLRADAEALAHPAFELLFDPQTSGGLLLAVDAERVDEAIGALHEAGDVAASVIGSVRAPTSADDGRSIQVVGSSTVAENSANEPRKRRRETVAIS